MGGTRAIRPRRLPAAPVGRKASGLTLLEMLVVFVLASLLGTLLIQGSGFFLGQYDTVKRIGRQASSEALQQRWFASTVHAMLPYLAEDRRFVGDSTSFRGVTMQPLRARPGIPIAARWMIVAAEGEGVAVVYAEQPSPCPSDTGGANSRSASACDPATTPFGDIRWIVLESAEPLTFRYAGLDGVWQDRWPAGAAREWIPRQVRLVTPAGQTVLTASFGLFQQPVRNPRDFR